MVVFNQIIHRIKVDQIHTMMDIIVEMEDTTAIQVVFNALRHICLQILITLHHNNNILLCPLYSKYIYASTTTNVSSTTKCLSTSTTSTSRLWKSKYLYASTFSAISKPSTFPTISKSPNVSSSTTTL